MIREATGVMNDAMAKADGGGGGMGHQATPTMSFFRLAEVTLSLLFSMFFFSEKQHKKRREMVKQ